MKHKEFDELYYMVSNPILLDKWIEKWFEECEDYLGEKFLAVKDENDA
jgi:hypothetical protein